MINVRKSTIKHTSGKSYYAVVVNPYVGFYESLVVYGSTEAVVRRKAERQLEAWKNQPARTPAPEEPVDDEDYLPF